VFVVRHFGNGVDRVSDARIVVRGSVAVLHEDDCVVDLFCDRRMADLVEVAMGSLGLLMPAGPVECVARVLDDGALEVTVAIV
jgi:hypothetical protein